MKNTPMSLSSRPVCSLASILAKRADSSIGVFSSKRLPIRSGYEILISRHTAGHAEEIIGFFRYPFFSSFLVASEMISAPFATSKTLSKPSSVKAVNM